MTAPTATPEVIAEVLQEYSRTTKSPFRTAQNLGLPVTLVFEILEGHKDAVDIQQMRHNGLGRPELQPFTVARRRVGAGAWDNALPEIAKARADYEAGTHEMATGRDGSWLILYSIPRKRKQPRLGYFKAECG